MNWQPRWLSRLQGLRRVHLSDENARILVSSDTFMDCHPSSSIEIANGTLNIGYPMPGSPPLPALNRSTIKLGKNARLITKGNVHIGEGVYLRVGDNAVLSFEGDNSIGRNSILFCSYQMCFGLRASCSWNVTLMDDDGHHFIGKQGTRLRKLSRPLILGEEASLQMNVTVPRGIRIGKKATVSANTTLRKNVPDECLVYQETLIKERPGIVFEL